MNNWKVIFAISFATAVIFGAGVFTGGLLVNRVDHSHWKNARRPEAPAPATNSILPTNSQSPPLVKSARLPEILSKQFLQRLNEELHLTPDQHEAIQKIITDGQNQMHKTMQDARLEIREQLTLEQRTQFDELVKRPLKRPAVSTNAPAVLSAPTNSPAPH